MATFPGTRSSRCNATADACTGIHPRNLRLWVELVSEEDNFGLLGDLLHQVLAQQNTATTEESMSMVTMTYESRSQVSEVVVRGLVRSLHYSWSTTTRLQPLPPN